MKIIQMKPFKNRKVDFNKPVSIYRNLNCKRGTVDYSIKQDNYVVAHTSNITLKDVIFKISKGGQNRARKTGIRNVHAFAQGYISIDDIYPIDDLIKITYNPFNDDFFIDTNNNKPVHDTNLSVFTKEGVFIL